MLHEFLARIAKEYAYQRVKPFTRNEFADFVKKDLVLELQKHLTFQSIDYKCKASVGQGQWASIPWLAIFDTVVTETARKGIYVVYLIDTVAETITLSLNQGTTWIYNQFGEVRGREVLARRARDLAELVPEFKKRFSQQEINLNSKASLPLGYEAGHIFGNTYDANNIPKEQFYADLDEILNLYRAVVDRGADTPLDSIEEEFNITDVVEARKYILSRRIERAPSVRKKVLSVKPHVCEGCGLDPKIHYSVSGAELTPLEVHHSKPISHLAEGEAKRYEIPNDFLVLCSNCHRIIHTQPDSSDLEQLRRRVTFVLPSGKPKNRLF